MSDTVTLASPPTTIQVVQNILSSMAAQSGVVTDYNIGSQIRTFSEATGSVIDIQGVSNAQQVLLALAYGSASAYGIEALPAQAATGTVTFATAFGSGAYGSPQAVGIPVGTIVATQGGVQYLTNVTATLAQGVTGINVGITAVIGGVGGNTTSGTVTQLLSNLGAPLAVNNAAPISGGFPAESPSVTLARLAAKQATFGLCSPYAVANACIGVQGSGGSICKFSGAWEPWIAVQASGGTGTAAFTVYCDDGSGTASADLLAAVTATLTGNSAAGQSGYRPIGVPFSVLSGTPIYAELTVSGTILPIASTEQVETSVQTALVTAMGLNLYGASVYQSQLAAITANAANGYFASLTVSLAVSGASGTPVNLITAGPGNRILLDQLTINITSTTS